MSHTDIQVFQNLEIHFSREPFVMSLTYFEWKHDGSRSFNSALIQQFLSATVAFIPRNWYWSGLRNFWLSEDPKGYVVAFKEGLEERFKKHKAKKKGEINNNNNNNSKKVGKQTIKAPKGYKIGRKTVWEQYDSVGETSQVK